MSKGVRNEIIVDLTMKEIDLTSEEIGLTREEIGLTSEEIGLTNKEIDEKVYGEMIINR